MHAGLVGVIPAILEQYRLPLFGTHGVTHWARVYENGMRLAAFNEADFRVVGYFAIFHDACRENEDVDPGHGRRGADLAQHLRTKVALDEAAFQLLLEACRLHTDGLIDGDITLQTCWDSDRLDLPRVGIPVKPSRLCTLAARQPGVISWADERARMQVEPSIVREAWDIERATPKNHD